MCQVREPRGVEEVKELREHEGSLVEEWKDPGSQKDGAQVGPRSRTLAREGLLFQGNNSHTHPLQACGEVDSGCSELEGGGATTPCSHAGHCELTPSSLPNTSSASQAQRALSGCQAAELSSASPRADGWQPQRHQPVDPRVPVMQPPTAFHTPP